MVGDPPVLNTVEYSICNQCNATIRMFRPDELDPATTLQAINTIADAHRAEAHPHRSAQ